MKNMYKISLSLAMLALSAASSPAQVVLGSFQGPGDPTDAGWVDPANGDPITTDPNASFPAAGVSGYSLSLEINGAGGFGTPSLELQFSPAQRAAFNTNAYITFTFSVPAWTSGGYSQIYNLALNAPGYGYQNQSWANSQTSGNNGGTTAGSDPNFYLWNGSPLQTQVVTISYTNVLAAISSGGESYLQMTFQGNNGGGAPTYIYMNNVVLSTGPFGVDAGPAVNLLGGFQGASDPTDAGWINAYTTNSITNDAYYSFVTAGVPGYTQSLEAYVGQSYGSNNLQLAFSPAQIAAFNTNSWITFTYSVPAWTNGGYAQIAELDLNAPGYGYNALSWANALEKGVTSWDAPGAEPLFYFWNGSPFETQQVSVNYASALPAIIAGGESYLQMTFQANNGGGGPPYYYLNNVELSTGSFGTTAAPAPPALSIQAAKPGLRIFAASAANTWDRAEVDTYPDGDEGWINHGTVSYSFTLQDFPVAPGMQCHIFLIPENTEAGGAGNVINNEYADWNATNIVWMTIVGGGANADGSSSYTCQVAWKTNDVAANPTNLALTIPGGIYTNTGVQSPVGTWTLTFNNNSSGTLTPPGVSPLPFTIADTSVATDFAGPVMAVFGLQPNSSGGEGTWIDYASISISGTANPISENFTTEPAANTIATSGYWDTSDSVVPAGVQLVTSGTPLWLTWPMTAVGYAVVESPFLPVTHAPGYLYYGGGPFTSGGSFVLPQQFNYYNDVPVTISVAGATNWMLLPNTCLPSADPSDFPGVTSAYFELINPAPVN